jgi:lipid-A-disaccharide synthase
MRYYLIAGEASGDLHGSNLIKALKAKDPQVEIRAWGGDKMQAAGAKLVKHYRELAFMGFWEVATNIRTILGNIRFCKEDIQAFKPDAIIYIDYPGFNLRIAEWAHKQGYLNYYYISPQIWAWHTSRVHKIKATIDRMFVILPFEKEFYRDYEMEVDYVGHPLMDVIPAHKASTGFREQYDLDERPIIALLPGSRSQEIKRLLKEMVHTAQHLPEFQYAIACAPSQERSYYEKLLKEYGSSAEEIALVENRTYDLLSHADAALVTSGTATLETALFRVPQVVCYKGSWLSFQIAKRLVDISYISLVNLIADKRVVEELIQGDCNTRRITEELKKLFEAENRRRMQADYGELADTLKKEGGGASERVASLIVKKK